MDSILSNPSIEFKGKAYELKQPTVGSLMDIEIMKGELTNDRYGSIVRHGTVISNWNLDNVDMFSNLIVLCPDLVKDIKVTNWRDLSLPDIQELKEEYNKTFSPWIEKHLGFLNPPVDEKKEEK